MIDEEINNDKKQKIITVLGIAILVLATIGATFAYFSSQASTASQTVTTGKINIKATSGKLNATNIKPTTWNSVIALNAANTDIAQITLSVNTFGTTVNGAKFDIYFTTNGIELNNSAGLVGGSLGDIKWKLVDSNSEIIGSGDFASGNVNEPLKANDNPVSIQIDAQTEEEAIKTFILFIYIEDNGQQDKLQNMEITATMSATAIQ